MTTASTTARIAVAFAAALAVTLVPAGTAQAATAYCETLTDASHPDWMGGLPDDTSLAALSIPGTHDTLSLHGGDITQTQEDHGDSAETLTAQLDAGVRAIDIRVRKVDDLFTIHHGTFYQNANFADVLAKADGFLAAHPGETIVLRLKAECTGDIGSCTDENSSKDTAEILDWYRDNDPNGGRLLNPADDGMPDLGSVRGKIVLGSLQEAQGGLVDGYGLSQFTNDNWGDYVQDEYQVPTIGDIETKWNHVRDHWDKTNGADSGEMFWNFSSGSSLGANPKTVACGTGGIRGVNDHALEHLAGNDVPRTGVVLMDFPGGELIDQIIARNS
ncbi:phosphatidylinositol-specific phospholipase C [Saccharopolyspora gregorii]|uniref:phosphatidylinositol-specific phospholipase C n=1 Tax=Saccharopolyspora gregorii TaxID=33914 RepID=UPI0021ACBAAA|nr:phosphatidylinositol-specific phospholipase C [Saccharopolyspora gregorii]